MSTSFIIENLAPRHDQRYRLAQSAEKRAYWSVVRTLVLNAYDRQLAAGVDRNGIPFAALKTRTILNRRSWSGHHDPYAPALNPAHHLSRSRSLLDARIEGEVVRVFWKADPITGKSWGRIMGYHAAGAGNNPVRDAMGLSPTSYAQVRVAAWLWWGSYARGETPLLPVRGKASRTPVFTVPDYVPKNPANHVAKSPRRIEQLRIGNNVLTLGGSTKGEIMDAMSRGQKVRWRGLR